MIPKVIHYCWFGDNSLSEDAKKYIDSWRKFCPDYKIIEWNENNFDVTENDYCREAYEAKKWAFVTDYVRLKVLYEYGGIYMDTDVEVCKNLDCLLKYEAVSGYESETSIPTGTLAACRGDEWIGMLLHDYDDRHFLQKDGSYDITTNVVTITRLTKEKYGLRLDGKRKVFGTNILILPFDYLCAKSFKTGIVEKTENTMTIHHFSGSWLTADVKKYDDVFKKNYKKLTWVPNEFMRMKTATILACYQLGGWYAVWKRFCESVFRIDS
ncbi:Glycosyltransferase sugar-binding region containing DXD motif-containing protein [Selenomonas sp. WCT3]|uniref:glycosyltransferase family 32 protein n=1 Tax=Selenomonas sp. WCT3 TaxID=3158785 RepID=UPI00088A07E8|nr:Glycosyltransferase sugar-binding region containing DXD motif-containing protein [Selenomonas ruminantium]